MVSVDVRDVRVEFPIYHGNSRSLKRTVFAAASGRLKEDARHRIVVQALRGVSFSLHSGDRLGLIGGNGAGKTTLLRTLAGVYEPVQGSTEISGTIGALLDPNQGMNPELTGRENIVLRGLYSGMPRASMRALEDDVAAFAELGEFLDLPVRFYSSGMMVRLGFAMATSIKPEVLLMDEWFLAGDAAFMDKAKHRLEGMVRGADILVLSSHSEPILLEWCTRLIRLEGGEVVDDGPPDEVMDRYMGRPPGTSRPALTPPSAAPRPGDAPQPLHAAGGSSAG